MEVTLIISHTQLPSSVGLLSHKVGATVLISFVIPEATAPEQRES